MSNLGNVYIWGPLLHMRIADWTCLLNFWIILTYCCHDNNDSFKMAAKHIGIFVFILQTCLVTLALCNFMESLHNSL